MKVYVATIGYRAEETIVGVFTTEAKAERAAKRALELHKAFKGNMGYVDHYTHEVNAVELDEFNEADWG